jgi:hypothetical protein
LIRSLVALTLFLFALAVGALLPRIALATQSVDGCTGVLHLDPATDSVTVAAPGLWCLDGDWLATDLADEEPMVVRITASDVTLDCRGHLVEYAGADAFPIGVYTVAGANRTIVRNCRFRGFAQAITVISRSGAFLIEDNVVESSRPAYSQPSASIIGAGRGIVRRNRVTGARDQGIVVEGLVDVTDNLIDGVVGDGANPVHGIHVGSALIPDAGAEISGNIVRGLDSTGAPAVGLFVEANSVGRISIRDNTLVGDGAPGAIAFVCEDTPPARVADNLVTGFATLATGCHDSGENDLAP